MAIRQTGEERIREIQVTFSIIKIFRIGLYFSIKYKPIFFGVFMDNLRLVEEILMKCNRIKKKIYSDNEKYVEQRGAYWCVMHGHPQNPDSPTDKPMGTPIKCFSIAKYGYNEAKRRAEAMHRAILSQQK